MYVRLSSVISFECKVNMNFIVVAVVDLGHTIPCEDYGRERKVRRLIPQGTSRENLL